MSDLAQSLSKLKGAFSFGEGKRQKISLGIDVGSSGVKAVELERKGGEMVLKNYALATVRGEGLIDIASQKIIKENSTEVIKRVIRESGIKTKEVNVSIPGFASLVATIEVPEMSQKEMEQVVRMEAPKHIPININDVSYGWQLIEEPNKGQASLDKLYEKEEKKDELKNGPQKKKILIVAITKEISNQYEKVFSSAGLSIDSLEIDTFSLTRSIMGGNRSCNLILGVGHKMTNIIVVVNDSILISRNIDIAGEKITEALSQGMGVDKIRAEQMKIQRGIQTGGEAGGQADVIIPVLRSITKEVLETVNTLKSNYPETNIENIILSGGTSKMLGFKEFVENEIGIRTIAGNPFAGVQFPEQIRNVIITQSPLFSVAVGLSAISFESQKK